MSKLYYYRTRYYDSQTGRFTSVDRVIREPKNKPVFSSFPSFSSFSSVCSCCGSVSSYPSEVGFISEINMFPQVNSFEPASFLHPYVYVENNPINYVDVFGRFPINKNISYSEISTIPIPDFTAPPSGLTPSQRKAWIKIVQGCIEREYCQEVCDALTQPGVGIGEAIWVNCVEICMKSGLKGIVELRRKSWLINECIQRGYAYCWHIYSRKWQSIQLFECMRNVRKLCKKIYY